MASFVFSQKRNAPGHTSAPDKLCGNGLGEEVEAEVAYNEPIEFFRSISQSKEHIIDASKPWFESEYNQVFFANKRAASKKSTGKKNLNLNIPMR